MPEPTRWVPDDSFHDLVDGEFKGVRRVQEALKELGLPELRQEVVSSRHPRMDALMERLRRKDMPEGFEKWQLPITPRGDRPSFLFMTLCRPNAVVPMHAHRNDSVFRVVLSGSIVHDGIELTAGDWIYIPKGKPYSYTAGQYGALVFHEYPGNE